MTQIGLYSGRLVDPTHLKKHDVYIDEIAYHLSRINRYNGGTVGEPYSVAEHCVLACEIAEHMSPNDAMFQMACLMHDAAEFVLGDMAAPMKRNFTNYKELESTINLPIGEALGYAPTWRHKDVERIDLGLRRQEMMKITNFPPCAWEDLPELEYEPRIDCHPWKHAKELFLTKFKFLKAKIDADKDRYERCEALRESAEAAE